MLSLIQLAVLRAEKQDKEKWLDEERVQIVEAAKEFAMKQEQTFVKKIDNLGQKLAQKEEDLQEMESVVKQLQYDLKTAQQEKVCHISRFFKSFLSFFELFSWFTYRKILKKKPRGLYFSKALFQGLIFGGAYVRREISVSKSIGLAL